MAKKKYYAVREGKTPGVYLTWDECKAQVEGFSGAVYKSFPTMEEAQDFAGMPPEEKMDQKQKAVRCERGSAVAYVDGSYNVATGEYSCGVVFITEDDEVHIATKGEDKELASMRNVAGEILGAQLAMKRAVEQGIKKLTIYYDYQGIASWCLGEWKTTKEGTKAYREYFDSVRARVEIRFVKVKGHSGDTYNDLADELAKSVIF